HMTCSTPIRLVGLFRSHTSAKPKSNLSFIWAINRKLRIPGQRSISTSRTRLARWSTRDLFVSNLLVARGDSLKQKAPVGNLPSRNRAPNLHLTALRFATYA